MSALLPSRRAIQPAWLGDPAARHAHMARSLNYATVLFPNYTTAVAAAKSLGFWDEETNTLRVSGHSFTKEGRPFIWAIEEVGQDIEIDPGIYDEEGGEIAPPSILAGYAVNVSGDIPEEVAPYVIPYGSAGRVFEGTVPEGFSYESIAGAPEGHLKAVPDPHAQA